MKKLISIFLIAMLSMIIISCSSNSNANGISNANINNNISSKKENGNALKTLVIYSTFIGEQYSVGVIEKGNTEIVADIIIEKLGADRYKVEPKVDNYPKDSYKKLTEIASEELHNNARPEIKDVSFDISNYDIIFVGSPVWWGDFPMIMYTLFEKVDMNGKIIAPFSTHGGSGLSGFDSKLKRLYPNATITKGLAITGTDAQNKKDRVRLEVDNWINSLNIGKWVSDVLVTKMNDEKVIKDLYIKMYKAMIDKDEDILNEIHSDSFVLIHMTGLQQDKETYINSILDGTLNYYSAETVDLDVAINGNKAKLIMDKRVN